MTTETTVKYPFGETPAEVIGEANGRSRDRIGLLRVNAALEISMFGPDDLLTVLDALRTVGQLSEVTTRWNAPLEAQAVEAIHNAKVAKAHKLRIEILAALGIDES